VVGLVRNRERARLRFQEALLGGDLEIIEQDVSEPLQCKGAFDFIVHAASQASPVYYKTDPVGTCLPMYSYVSLAERCPHGDPGLLYFSSGEVYASCATERSRPQKMREATWTPPMYVPLWREQAHGEDMCVSWAQQ